MKHRSQIANIAQQHISVYYRFIALVLNVDCVITIINVYIQEIDLLL